MRAYKADIINSIFQIKKTKIQEFCFPQIRKLVSGEENIYLRPI